MKFTSLRDEKKARKWMWAALLIFVALQIYFVQQMLAVLILFTAMFVMCLLIALVLYAVDRVGKLGIGWASQHIGVAARQANSAWHIVETASKKQLRRLRSEPAR